jgi:hypothetical protein
MRDTAERRRATAIGRAFIFLNVTRINNKSKGKAPARGDLQPHEDKRRVGKTSWWGAVANRA